MMYEEVLVNSVNQQNERAGDENIKSGGLDLGLLIEQWICSAKSSPVKPPNSSVGLKSGLSWVKYRDYQIY